MRAPAPAAKALVVLLTLAGVIDGTTVEATAPPPPPEVGFVGNQLADPFFESPGAAAGWAGPDGGAVARTAVAAEVRSGAAAARVEAGGSVHQTVQFLEAPADGAGGHGWPTQVRLRGCSVPISVTAPGCDAAQCPQYTLTAAAAVSGNPAAAVSGSASFNPGASGYHCREVTVTAATGIRSVAISAGLSAGGGASGAAAFDDFDAVVVEPYCWGETSYCRGVREVWAGSRMVPTAAPVSIPPAPTSSPTPSPTPAPAAPPAPGEVESINMYAGFGAPEWDYTRPTPTRPQPAASTAGRTVSPPSLFRPISRSAAFRVAALSRSCLLARIARTQRTAIDPDAPIDRPHHRYQLSLGSGHGRYPGVQPGVGHPRPRGGVGPVVKARNADA